MHICDHALKLRGEAACSNPGGRFAGGRCACLDAWIEQRRAASPRPALAAPVVAHAPKPVPFPPPDPDGPGSILHAALKRWGFGSCSACSAHARRMDALGAPAVLAGLDSHVAEIKSRAKLVPEAAIRLAVEWACKESIRRKSAP